MVVKEKMHSMVSKASKVLSCAGAMAMSLPTYAFADDFFNQTVTVDPNAVDATSMMGKLLGVISAVFIIIGIFRCGTAIFSILEAYSEDNSAAINKGVKQLAIGAVFIAAPLLMNFLFD